MTSSATSSGHLNRLAVAMTAGLLTSVLASCTDVGASEGRATSRQSVAYWAVDYGYTMLPDGEPEALEPGSWGIAAVGVPDGPVLVVDVPEDFTGERSFVHAHERDGAESFRAVGYWNVESVFQHACGRRALAVPADTADEVAAALRAQALTRTTRPVPVSVGGYDGLFLELRVPRLSSCGARPYPVFDTSDAERGASSWMVERYWVLDIEGDAFIIDAAVDRRTTGRELAQVVEMVESARFVESADDYAGR